MSRTVNANILTDAADVAHEVCYCIEVDFTAPKRVTDNSIPIYISGDKFEPGSLVVGSISAAGEPRNVANVTVGHDPGDASDWGRLDLAQDATGRAVQIWEVWQTTGGGQVEHLIFDGVVADFRGGDVSCGLVCRRDVGVITRPGSFVCWSDEFPHVPEPGATVNLGEIESSINEPPNGYWYTWRMPSGEYRSVWIWGEPPS